MLTGLDCLSGKSVKGMHTNCNDVVLKAGSEDGARFCRIFKKRGVARQHQSEDEFTLSNCMAMMNTGTKKYNPDVICILIGSDVVVIYQERDLRVVLRSSVRMLNLSAVVKRGRGGGANSSLGIITKRFLKGNPCHTVL